MNKLTVLICPLLFLCTAVAADDCKMSVIPLGVLDTDLAIMRNLRVQDLRVHLGGKPVELASIGLQEGPRHIVIMIDTSGSMEGPDERSNLGATLPTAMLAVELLPANASAALLTFNDKVTFESSGFEDRKTIAERVHGLAQRKPQGETALGDAIHEAISLLGTPQLGDAIYLVSDGGENSSKVTIPAVRHELIAHGVRVFAFVIEQHRLPRSMEDLEGPITMHRLAAATGGYVLQVRPEEIRKDKGKALSKTASALRSQAQWLYQLVVENPAELKGTPRVKVQLVNRELRKVLGSLNYPQEYAACIYSE